MSLAVKPHILVIDDTSEVRDMLVLLLEAHYQVSAASSGSEALVWVGSSGHAIDKRPIDRQQPRPDLILLDVLMPGMDGYEVMQRLANDARTADIPVIFLTALSSVAEEQRGLDLGATDYITKPISPPILLSRVRMHIERSRNARRLKRLSEQLSRYLAPQVYQSLFDGSRQAQIQTQRKRLTVFFSDIKDFTAFTADWQPDKVTTLLNHYFAEMSEIAADYGATLDKFIGDAIVIFFGDPQTRGIEQDALQCVRMAVAMQQRMPALQQHWRSMGIAKPFAIRIGIHSGFCDVGNFGSNLRMEYTIIGREVNLAARLEQAAQPGQVLISEETAALVQGQMVLCAQPPVQAKGFADPIAVFSMDIPALGAGDAVGTGTETGMKPGQADRSVPAPAALPGRAVMQPPQQALASPALLPITTVPAATLPAAIAGIDLVTGLARAMHKVPLYVLLLQRFAQSRRDTALRIREALVAGDKPTAELLSHSLRGVAAQLGATAVPHHAERLEQALREGLSPDVVEALLQTLQVSLGELVGALDAVFPDSGLPAASQN